MRLMMILLAGLFAASLSAQSAYALDDTYPWMSNEEAPAEGSEGSEWSSTSDPWGIDLGLVELEFYAGFATEDVSGSLATDPAGVESIDLESNLNMDSEITPVFGVNLNIFGFVFGIGFHDSTFSSDSFSGNFRAFGSDIDSAQNGDAELSISSYSFRLRKEFSLGDMLTVGVQFGWTGFDVEFTFSGREQGTNNLVSGSEDSSGLRLGAGLTASLKATDRWTISGSYWHIVSVNIFGGGSDGSGEEFSGTLTYSLVENFAIGGRMTVELLKAHSNDTDLDSQADMNSIGFAAVLRFNF